MATNPRITVRVAALTPDEIAEIVRETVAAVIAAQEMAAERRSGPAHRLLRRIFGKR